VGERRAAAAPTRGPARQAGAAAGGRPGGALAGIVFVLQSGIPWDVLPPEMGCGSGVACWRRSRRWQRRGVWKKLLAAGAGAGAPVIVLEPLSHGLTSSAQKGW
jgi:transposase